jgi:hypothetical protein
MANADIKQETKSANVKLWQVAEHYNGGMNDCNFSRVLRHELSAKEKVKIRSIISELKKAQKCQE